MLLPGSPCLTRGIACCGGPQDDARPRGRR
jgi:hypothetical protein